MAEISVIKHYKKQLIHRQSDPPELEKNAKEEAETDLKNNNTIKDNKNVVSDPRKVRRKRKNKNCRGQFRHEALELIKLGKNSLQVKEKPPDPPPTVLHPTPVTHHLPQMVPERRQSRDLTPRPPSAPVYRPEYNPFIFPYYPAPFALQAPARSISHLPPHPPVHLPSSSPRKRKTGPEERVVAAIDLTVDHEKKCHCDEGLKSPQELIVPVPREGATQVPRAYYERKMGSEQLRFERGGGEEKQMPRKEPKLPQLFLIEDLLSKGEKLPSKPLHHRVPERGKPPVGKPPDNPPKIVKIDNGRVVPIRTEPSRVIVSPKSNDYSVKSIIGRRQSADVDTISVSSSSSESPRPRFAKQIPQGKLFYYRLNNSFIRYFDDTQKKLFMDNLIADGTGCEVKTTEEYKEVIELPRSTSFSASDSLTVEEYVCEMTLVEKYIPRDFFLFYKFVTGYQICNNNNPVSFLTFLKLYNTNRLKILLERYINGLKMAV